MKFSIKNATDIGQVAVILEKSRKYYGNDITINIDCDNRTKTKTTIYTIDIYQDNDCYTCRHLIIVVDGNIVYADELWGNNNDKE